MTGKFICGLPVMEYEKAKHDGIEEGIRRAGYEDKLSFFDFTDNTECVDRDLDRISKEDAVCGMHIWTWKTVWNWWRENTEELIWDMEWEGEI